MMKILRYIFLPAVFLLAGFSTAKSDFCGIRNTTFKNGETVTMKVFYSALGAYVGAGEATFSTKIERYNGKPVYHFVA
jgi:hypothetical protein